MSIDIDKLERLYTQIRPFNWYLFNRDTYVGICNFDCKTPLSIADKEYIIAACNHFPDLISENKELRKRSTMNSGRAFYLADFIADGKMCAFCPVYEDCHESYRMCKAECIGKLYEWADKQAAKGVRDD